MVGIVRYGSYVPYFRLQRSAIGAGRGERSTASYDEDTVSMAVEAGRDALRDAATPDTLLFATLAPPYAEKLNAATLQAALNLPGHLAASDLGGSSRAGLSTLLMGIDLAAAGRTTLVCTSDMSVGAPGGARETGGGDAAAAFLCGSGDDVAAKLIGRASSTAELLDSWRTPDMRFPKQWEERFGETIMLPVMVGTLKHALADAGKQPSDITTLIVDSTNPRVDRGVPGELGFTAGQVADSLASTVGRSGVAHAGLLLAAALDTAKPGDLIAVLVGADGADAAIFEVTEKIESARPKHTVARWLETKRNDLPYNSYLKWRGVLPFEPPRRPDPARPAGPPMQRSETWKYGFVGARCTNCGSANLPPQRVCVVCGTLDQMEDEAFADADCKVATYTLDHLAYSLQPPVVSAIVDFEKGGRINCQLTDVDPDSVAIGDELEMSFRLMYTAEGVHNYFWKARPRR